MTTEIEKVLNQAMNGSPNHVYRDEVLSALEAPVEVNMFWQECGQASITLNVLLLCGYEDIRRECLSPGNRASRNEKKSYPYWNRQ